MYLRFSIPAFEIPVAREQMSTADVKSELGQERTGGDSRAMK